MANAFKLATTLPPFLYDGTQSIALTPVVSATYAPEDFERRLNTQTHLLGLETINRAVMSGKNVAESVEMVKKSIRAYHEANIRKMPAVESLPVLGMPTMKSMTMKHMKNAME